jgi:hypothetical protein
MERLTVQHDVVHAHNNELHAILWRIWYLSLTLLMEGMTLCYRGLLVYNGSRGEGSRTSNYLPNWTHDTLCITALELPSTRAGRNLLLIPTGIDTVAYFDYYRALFNGVVTSSDYKPRKLRRLINDDESGWLSRYSDRIRAGRPGFNFRQKQFFSLSLQRPDRQRGPLCPLSNGYRRDFPGHKAVGAWSWPLASTTAEVKNGGAVSSLPYTSSWYVI